MTSRPLLPVMHREDFREIRKGMVLLNHSMSFGVAGVNLTLDGKTIWVA